MNRSHKGTWAGLILAAVLALPAMGQNRLATIDLRKVFDNYWKRQQAESALKERGAAMDKELKGMMDDYNKTKEDYGKLLESANDQAVTAEERDKRKRAAETKLLDLKTSENTIRTYEDNAREQLDAQKKRMRDSILEEIRSAINAKAKVAGYTLVVDTASESFNQTPIILYTNGENDLTDAILTQLNAASPPPASSDSPKDGTKTDGKK